MTDVTGIKWDDARGIPAFMTLDELIYRVRRADGANGLLYDPVTIAELTEDADEQYTFDALVVQAAKLQRKTEVIQRVLNQTSRDLQVVAAQVSDPFKRQGTIQVAVVFELSDGQTVSIMFHNPDATNVKSLKPQDDLISWKWLLNKMDITIAVAPERGQDLNVRVVAARVMKLAAKNSAAFARKNAKRADRLALIEGLKVEIADLEDELDGLNRKIDETRMLIDEKTAAAMARPREALSAFERIKQFLNPRQRRTLYEELQQGATAPDAVDRALALAELIDSMSTKYAEESKPDPVAYLRYTGGRTEVYVTGKDDTGNGVDQVRGWEHVDGQDPTQIDDIMLGYRLERGELSMAVGWRPTPRSVLVPVKPEPVKPEPGPEMTTTGGDEPTAENIVGWLKKFGWVVTPNGKGEWKISYSEQYKADIDVFIKQGDDGEVRVVRAYNDDFVYAPGAPGDQHYYATAREAAEAFHLDETADDWKWGANETKEMIDLLEERTPLVFPADAADSGEYPPEMLEAMLRTVSAVEKRGGSLRYGDFNNSMTASLLDRAGNLPQSDVTPVEGIFAQISNAAGEPVGRAYVQRDGGVLFYRGLAGDTPVEVNGEPATISGSLASLMEMANALLGTPGELGPRPDLEPGPATDDPTDPVVYASLLEGGEEALAFYQDQLDSFFTERVIEVSNALREIGWNGDQYGMLFAPFYSEDGTKPKYAFDVDYRQVGAGKNVVGATYLVKGEGAGFRMSDRLDMTPAEIAQAIHMAAETADATGRRETQGKTGRIQITDGPFAGFELIPKSEYGVRSEDYAVNGRKGTRIGTIGPEDVAAFRGGDPAGFVPVSNWRLTFSAELMALLGLNPKQQDGLKPPDGYQEFEYYDRDGNPVIGYAKFLVGDRVKAADGVRGTGRIISHVGSGPIITQYIVAWDNGTENGEDERDLVALPPAIDAGGDDMDPVERVDAVYLFNATDEFKEWVAESLDATDYSPFATARAMDEKARELGANIKWALGGAIVGKIKKGRNVLGRIEMGDDGKAMVYIGTKGKQRVKFPSGAEAVFSDSDAPAMVAALLAPMPKPKPPNPDADGLTTAPFEPGDILLLMPADGVGEPMKVNYRGPLDATKSVVVSVKSGMQMSVLTSLLKYPDETSGRERKMLIESIIKHMGTDQDVIRENLEVVDVDPGMWRDMVAQGARRYGANIIDMEAFAAEVADAMRAMLVEPEPDSWTPEAHVRIAADDITRLRRSDVERVLDLDEPRLTQMADYIKRNRPDLVDEVNDLLGSGEPEPTPEPNPDATLFQSVIDGTVPDILDPALADDLIAAYERAEAAGDPDALALAEQAMDAYEKAAMDAEVPK